MEIKHIFQNGHHYIAIIFSDDDLSLFVLF